jgi:hypothetical protein
LKRDSTAVRARWEQKHVLSLLATWQAADQRPFRPDPDIGHSGFNGFGFAQTPHVERVFGVWQIIRVSYSQRHQRHFAPFIEYASGLHGH